VVSHERPRRTTIFKRHQAAAYFQTSGRHLAWPDRWPPFLLARHPQSARPHRGLDEQGSQTPAGKMGEGTMPAGCDAGPVDGSILWAGNTNDLSGLAVGSDGLVVLPPRQRRGDLPGLANRVITQLPSPPIRWGVALTGERMRRDAFGRDCGLPGQRPGIERSRIIQDAEVWHHGWRRMPDICRTPRVMLAGVRSPHVRSEHLW